MSLEKYKILIVEDDNFLLNMYATKFELDGFEVFLADDGEKALRLAQKELPDVILLDVLIPKMNGFEVLKVLKSMDKTKDIKILLLTNLSQRDEVEHGLEGGAVDYLIKAHFMPSEVVDKVKKMIVG